MAPEIAAELLRQGPLGLLALAEAYVIVRLWKDLRDEHRARMTEAKETTAQLLAVSAKTNETVTKLHELGQWIEAQKQTTHGRTSRQT